MKNIIALILLGDNYETLEFWYPYLRLKEAGIEVVIISSEIKEYRSKIGYTANPDFKVTDIEPTKYDLLIIPGGDAPKKLREDQNIINLVRKFNEHNKPIATICHGAQILITANIVNKARISTTRDVEKELIEAGGFFVDNAVTVDRNFITSRRATDLPKFMQAVLNVLKIQ